MTPDIEREYRALIEIAEAYFAAGVRWSNGRLEPNPDETDVAPRYSFAERWLLSLDAIRKRELVEPAVVPEKAMHA